MASPAQIGPIQQVTLKKSDLDDESLTLVNQQLTNIVQQINNLMGINGPVKFASHIDLGSNRIMNVGAAVDPTDAVSQSFGESQFGAAALAPALNALGKQMLQTYRQLSNPDQRERSSSFLNSLASTSPTANTSFVTFGVPSGGTVTATVGAGLHERVDGSVFPYSSRTDTVSLPTAFAISSLTRSSNIVTAVTAPSGLAAGDGFTVINASDPSFDGTFVVLTVISGTSFTYFQGGPDGSTGGGSISVGGVYYYTISPGQTVLGLIGGFSSDTWTNRRLASFDGTTIIAVVVTNAGGGDTVNSAGGGTPPHSNSAAAIIRRM